MKKFIASFSGGKDSTLAIYRAIKMGYEPISLITTYNTDVDRSWFHGIPENILEEVSKSLKIPYKLIKTTGDKYAENFLIVLKEFASKGVECVVFGDIDIEEHRSWCTERCILAGLEAVFPLWNEDRRELTHEFINAGFKSIITIVDANRLPERFLGKVLDLEVIEEIVAENVDACGENGEYHTFAFAGPIFNSEICYELGELRRNKNYTALTIY